MHIHLFLTRTFAIAGAPIPIMFAAISGIQVKLCCKLSFPNHLKVRSMQTSFLEFISECCGINIKSSKSNCSSSIILISITLYNFRQSFQTSRKRYNIIMGKNKRRQLLVEDTVHNKQLSVDSVEEVDTVNWLCEAT